MVTSVEIVVANCNYSPAQRQKKNLFPISKFVCKVAYSRWGPLCDVVFQRETFLKVAEKNVY